MGRNSPESMARKRSVTCNLCRQRKEIDAHGNLCHACTSYVIWRKTEMPDEREFLYLTAADLESREQRIRRYAMRAELGLPLFDQVGEESAA